MKDPSIETGQTIMDSAEKMNCLNVQNYEIFEAMSQPACVIGKDGEVAYGNRAFLDFFSTAADDIHLDWAHPLFPEYRNRIAKAYLKALKGTDNQCFAVLNSPEKKPIPVEIILFPLSGHEGVHSILALIKILDDKLLSFDSSTLSYISKENFQYDNIHYEFSPLPIIRLNDKFEVVKCSHSSESYFGYTREEMIEKKSVDISSLFCYDKDRFRNSVADIFSGAESFHRIGETKIISNGAGEKIANVSIYPIIQSNTVAAAEVIFEDLTALKNLKDEMNSMNRIQMIGDITKGFLHSLNNTINVVMSKTQLLLQITEKDSVLEGIKIIEESALDIVGQIRRVQNFVGENNSLSVERVELLTDMVEDAIEFAKIKFKVEDKEKRQFVKIDRKYFSGIYLKIDTRIMREIIILMILKAADFIRKHGTINIILKENHDITLTAEVIKTEDMSEQREENISSLAGIDIRRTAEKIKIKFIEEESAETYCLKAIIPQRLVHREQKIQTDTLEFKLRDLDILIVEDETALKKILFDIFDKMGNRVFICEDGSEALNEFKKKRYDIVITDYSTHGLTGIELAARVKEISETTVTVLLTGWTINNLQAYKNVLDIFHPKPFKIEDLLKSIAVRMKEIALQKK